MAKYIQRKDHVFKTLETVDEFETYKEAKAMVKEYRMSDPSAQYYISQRACKDWHRKEPVQESKPAEETKPDYWDVRRELKDQADMDNRSPLDYGENPSY